MPERKVIKYLEWDSMDDPDDPRTRVEKALAWAREERDRLLYQYTREAEAAIRHVEHDQRIIEGPSGAEFTGSYGAQFDVAKYNALTGGLYVVERTIKVLKEVLAGFPLSDEEE